MKKWFLLLFPLTACSVSYNVKYDTTNVPSSDSLKPFPIIVNFKTLEDIRHDDSINILQFTEDKFLKIDSVESCINSNKYYKKDSLASQITKAIVSHFNHQRLFDYTLYNDPRYSAYYITGNLKRYYGTQEFSNSAMVASQFGLLGGLTTMAMKKPAKITIEISDLKLYKQNGELVKELGSFSESYEEEMGVDGYCWCIYTNIDLKLKEFNSKLVTAIRTELADLKLK